MNLVAGGTTHTFAHTPGFALTPQILPDLVDGLSAQCNNEHKTCLQNVRVTNWII